MIEKLYKLYNKRYPHDSGDWPYFLECYFTVLERSVSEALANKTLKEFEEIYCD